MAIIYIKDIKLLDKLNSEILELKIKLYYEKQKEEVNSSF